MFVLLEDVTFQTVLLAGEGGVYSPKCSSNGHKYGQWHFRPEVRVSTHLFVQVFVGIPPRH